MTESVCCFLKHSAGVPTFAFARSASPAVQYVKFSSYSSHRFLWNKRKYDRCCRRRVYCHIGKVISCRHTEQVYRSGQYCRNYKAGFILCKPRNCSCKHIQSYCRKPGKAAEHSNRSAYSSRCNSLFYASCIPAVYDYEVAACKCCRFPLAARKHYGCRAYQAGSQYVLGDFSASACIIYGLK